MTSDFDNRGEKLLPISGSRSRGAFAGYDVERSVVHGRLTP